LVYPQPFQLLPELVDWHFDWRKINIAVIAAVFANQDWAEIFVSSIALTTGFSGRAIIIVNRSSQAAFITIYVVVGWELWGVIAAQSVWNWGALVRPISDLFLRASGARTRRDIHGVLLFFVKVWILIKILICDRLRVAWRT
jgi:hypothetical protein